MNQLQFITSGVSGFSGESSLLEGNTPLRNIGGDSCGVNRRSGRSGRCEILPAAGDFGLPADAGPLLAGAGRPGPGGRGLPHGGRPGGPRGVRGVPGLAKGPQNGGAPFGSFKATRKTPKWSRPPHFWKCHAKTIHDS